jgi:DNA polymerase III alpha subunit (gram-positive type)
MGHYIACVDLETTGLDSENDKIIEVGAVLWDSEMNTAVKMASLLIKGVSIPANIKDLTGIQQEHCDKFGIELLWALETLNVEYFYHSSYIMAHNAIFDKTFIERDFKKLNLESLGPVSPWIDTRYDIPYGKESMGKGELVAIAAKHGFLNPFAHRAVFDCLTTCVLASKYSWDKIIERSKSPNIKVRALVNFDNNKKAKDAGFYWKAESKMWLKDMKQCDYFEDMWSFPSKVVVLP